jgi:hypothetical protein
MKNENPTCASTRAGLEMETPNSRRAHRTTVLLRRNGESGLSAEAARIIIATPDRYGGAQSALVCWAWRILGRPQPPKPNLWISGAPVARRRI